MMIAKRQKLAAIDNDPRFQSLDETTKKTIRDLIERRLDISEMSARREQGGH